MSAPSECHCRRAKHKHGTRAAYQCDGCRCLPCRLANSHANAAYTRGDHWHESRVTPEGMQRRLQALQVIGWTWEAMGARLGISRQAVYSMSGARGRRSAYTHTAERVRALYDELWSITPEGVAAHRCRLSAARKGWLPPLAWDDDEIDNPDATPRVPAGSSPWELQPCGTSAAARRHYRRGEPLDDACRNAARRQRNDRKKAA